MKTITLQPSAHTDQITEDGTELTKLPYPFHVHPSGTVQRQDFWRGRVHHVVGFAHSLAVYAVDLWWGERFLEDPQQAVGMYVVTSDEDDRWSTHVTAIESVTVHE